MLLSVPRVRATLAIGALWIQSCAAFYLPGVAPHDYTIDDPVPLTVNSLTQMSNQQVKSVISYDYYDERFHFCKPEGGPEKQSESLGSILFGDRIFSSPFELRMGKDQTCELLCETEPIPTEDAKFINQCITDGYAMNWVIDGLPAAHEDRDEHTQELYYNIGFSLGYTNNGQPALNNHYKISIYYHDRPDGKRRVVGVVVHPISKDTKLDAQGKPDCSPENLAFYLKEDGKSKVVYTYDVEWLPSETAWATRWDMYLHILDPSIHWFSLVNSIVIVLFLTGMVAMILLRALHKDISRYNSIEAQEDVQEDYGWKLIHGDVFRAPPRPMLLSVLVGSGTQLIAMTALTLVFAVLGFLSPSNRGSLATVMIIFFMVFACISGYVSARIYKMNGGEAWKLNVFMTAVLFPGAILGALFALNFFLIASHSSGAVPFGTMVAVLALYMIISFPLSVAGSYFGFRKPRIEQPVRTNQIPRQIPDQPFYLQPIPSILMGGILPFGAIFIELYFVMNSIWFHRIYYGIGFLFLVFSVLLLTCSQVTILMCYFHLCNEDYHWSWRSFLTAGACGLYVFLYSILYYFTKLEIDDFISTVLYAGYSGIISVMVSVLTGSVGYLACLFFLRKIFSSIKVD
ncbi:endosomal p24a protein [Lichtheimia corymbifera JMRC:FSU:9682]|uniref:Transmembrane 9 superfamily member n=1 Tax=Lichtheimia corymbifera JMRC:FSU:9682 TaxID=1263082 RepID=A0A068S1G5_9FUNG|nr:endosomal p24a protein [Lichtheimia corymbifera JMRC:FSU:9682]